MSNKYEKSQWEKDVKKLNSKPEFMLFEVGPSGTLVGGDIELSKGPDDEFEATITDVKPGIWHVALEYEKHDEPGMDEFQRAIARWVAPGPLNVETLSAAFPGPNLTPLSAWRKVGSYSVDSGSHGVFDKEGLETITEAEGGDRQYVLETCSDWSHEAQLQVSCQIGFVVGGDDGGYRLWARSHEGKKVEIMVKPNREEDDEEEDGENGEDGENEEDEEEKE